MSSSRSVNCIAKQNQVSGSPPIVAQDNSRKSSEGLLANWGWTMAGYMDCPWSALLPNFHLKCAFLLPPFGNRACGLSLCMHLGHLPLPGFVVRLSPPWTYIGVCIPCTQEYFGGRYRRFLELKRALSQGICLSCARSKQHNDDLSLFYLQLHLMSAW